MLGVRLEAKQQERAGPALLAVGVEHINDLYNHSVIPLTHQAQSADKGGTDSHNEGSTLCHCCIRTMSFGDQCKQNSFLLRPKMCSSTIV